VNDVQPVEDGVGAARELIAATVAAATALRDAGIEAIGEAIKLVLERNGRVIVTGLGKSGLIGAKMAATLASTGTPANFVHAADALHGDSGMVRPDDVLLALSKSGETAEVVAFARMAAARDVPVISLTGCRGGSPLCEIATVRLDAFVEREADRWDLVPTASTTVSLIVGDALAVGLMAARGFGPDEFREFHPGGSLGRRLGSALEA
jgi:arabinose-5-phosphate isomerase